jgi:hypothetical protein
MKKITIMHENLNFNHLEMKVLHADSLNHSNNYSYLKYMYLTITLIFIVKKKIIIKNLNAKPRNFN